MAKQTLKKKGGKPDGRRSKLDAGKVLELAGKGVSQSDIARAQGVSPATVCRFLDKHGPEAQELAAFKEGRADWIHALSKRGAELLLRLLDSLANEDIESASLAERKELIRVLGTLFGISSDKIAQLEGKATDGVAVQVVINTTPEALGMTTAPVVKVSAAPSPGGQVAD